MSEVMTAATFDILADAKYVLVTTFRRDGTPVPTPMGHAVADGIVYTTTLEAAARSSVSGTIGASRSAPATCGADPLARHTRPPRGFSPRRKAGTPPDSRSPATGSPSPIGSS